ncbi:hypothetical protein B0H14DRAFT_3775582 [Mycena olivaceomarginata]|nr:hypothetical protein B0H14DRAFT_3775582 [Mycena olivaceomarginata]
MTSLCSTQLPPLLSILLALSSSILCQIYAASTQIPPTSPTLSLREKRLDYELANPAPAGPALQPSRRQVYSRVPLSDRSNAPEDPQPTEVEPNFGVEARLIRLQTGIVQIQATLNENIHSFQSTHPSAQKERSMADKCVGEALLVDAVDASSSLDDAGTVELGIGLARLREELEEFEELVERTEARKRLIELALKMSKSSVRYKDKVDAVAQTFVGVRVEFVVPDTEDVQDGGLLFCESLGQELEVLSTEYSHRNSDDQIKRKDKYQEEYGNFCTKLTERYKKSFDYQRQHSLYHSTPDICDKGPHFIYCTRVNEGFHQETREIYNRLNGRDVDKQMSGLDAIREAMALIRMNLDQYDKDISERIARLAGQIFDTNLRSFIQNTFPDEPLREDGEDIITIRPFQCIYIHYTSLEDWTDKCDVLRYNLSFQVNHEERFDCVVINMDNDPLKFGRMLYLLKCCLPSGATEDIALVRLFKKSTWRPKTMWKNCQIFEESAHNLYPTATLYEVADSDWLLRAGN